MLVPGQELRDFKILRPGKRETNTGREVIGSYEEVGTLKAILAQATPEEVERWRQINHTVSHKLIMRHNPPVDVLPGDVFERNGRRFFHKTMPNDPGDLGHVNIFYCNERTDAG